MDNYSKDELSYIINSATSMREVLDKLGYKTPNGRNHIVVKKRIDKFGISCEHFRKVSKSKRTKENVFCNNSTASQATLRRWYSKISDDNLCEICGQTKIWNGKNLTMILDHIDGDNHNNQFFNLRWVCPNCNSQLPTFAGRNLIGRNDYTPMSYRKKMKKICPICNINEIGIKSKMCTECWNKEKSRNIPPKDELEELIYKKSFVEIGKKYGVSDNAIRKWCKKYGLPFRYGELHKYSA